jgi:hypothetical protein
LGYAGYPVVPAKYNQMRGHNGWDSLAQDVEYVGSVYDLSLCDLEYELTVHVQRHTSMSAMSTNGQHRTGKGVLVDDPNELRQDVSDQLQVPLGSILYQLVSVNIDYPKSHTWDEEVVTDLKAYSAAEDKQGGLQVLCDWKDAVQSVINS